MSGRDDQASRAHDLVLTHVDERGRARMVDVTGKPETLRQAVARCVVRSRREAIAALGRDGDAVAFARAAGITAAKRAADLIPLCHPLPLDDVDVQMEVAESRIDIVAVTAVIARTGVEMEALTACAVAGLSITMALLVADPEATLGTLALWHKSGGRSGEWRREDRSRGGAPSTPEVVTDW